MADGAQRLLDVIDDPNALESFLGGLTSASDLLESAESVDTVVASLAQSLAADYEVDSPNETLFDTFEASSANLTDISQSYVPSDFENAGANIVYGLSNGLPSSSSSGLSQSAEQLSTAHGQGQAQTFEANAHTGELLNSIGSSATLTSTSSSSSANTNVEALVNSNLGQQFHNSVCDSNNFLSTVGTEQQQQQQQEAPSSTPIISSSSTPVSQNSLSFSQLTNVLHTQHQQQVNAHQVNVSNPSLSSSSSNNIVSSSSSGNAVISTEGFTTFTATSTATSSSPLISVQNVVSSSSSSLTGTTLVTSAAGIGTISIQQRQQLHNLQQQSAQQVQQQTLVPQNQQLQRQILTSQNSQLVQQQGLISQNTQIVQQQQQVQQSQLLQQQIQQLQANQLQQQPLQQVTQLQQQSVQQLQQSIQQITQLQQQNQLQQQTQLTQQQILQGQLSTINPVSSQSNTICNVVSSATNTTPTIVNTSTSAGNIQVHQPSVSQPSFIVTSTGQTVSQIVQQQQQQAQTVSLPSMTVGSLTTPSTGLVSNVINGAQGTNVMHIQSGAQGQQFITVDAQQTPTLIATAGGATFGGANFVLTANPGGTPTYAVLPSAQQYFANAIVQPGLQALKSSSGQTFFQTANGSIVAAATNTIQGLQNLNVQGIRAKTQPQILPKPVSAGVAAATAATVTTADGQSSSTVTTTEQQQAQATQQGQVGQIIQSGQIQVQNSTMGAGIVTSVSNGGVTFSQPSFTFNSAGGIGQVMVSGVGGATQHSQLAGTATIVLNQFGQPMLLPTGGASQNNGLQFILRQQPTQQAQVLTIQTPQGTATTTAAAQAAAQGSTANVKQVVRYVPQLTQNQTVQIQQIQTPNGIQYIAVRCPPTSQPSAGTQFVGQVTNAATTTMQTATTEIQQQVPPPAPAPVVTPSAPRPPAPQVSTNQAVNSSSTPATPTMINTLQQQTLASITQKTKQQITIKAERVTEQPRSFNTGNQSKQSATSSSADNSSPNTPSSITATPKKKKPSKKKKVVTLDLDEILKQSGIGDEDLQDDSCFENIPNMSMQNDASNNNGYQYNATSQSTASVPSTQTQSMVKPNGSLNKSNSDLPVNILSPHVHVLQPTTHLPKGGRSNNNNKNGSNASLGGAGSSNKKPMPKKSPAKRKTSDVNNDEPPSKISTSYQVNNKSPNNMSPKFTPSPAFKNSPNNSSKNMTKKNNSPKMAQNNNNNSINNNNNNFNNNVSSSPVNNTNNKKKPSPKRPPATPKGGAAAKNMPVKRPMVSAPVTPTPSPQQSAAPAASSTTPVNSSVATTVNGSTSGTQRVVHTIQLTPQNQQLLRNIQVQINRLMSLPKRNDTEQTALQKLIFLQQQVIATGTPVPSPAGNLSGSVTTGATTIITNAPSVPNSSAAATTSNPNAATIPPTLSTANSNYSNSISNSVPAQRSIKTSATTFGGPVNNSSSTFAVSTASANFRANSSVVASTPNGANNCSGQNIPNSVNAYVANITAQNNLVIKSEKTDVTDSFAPDQGANNKGGSGPSQGYPAGSTVVVLDDPKIAEQRRAAAKAEEEARAKWRKEQFDFLLKRDQEFFVEPDYKTPFTSKEDAVERLMKYHLGRDRTEMDFDDFDEEFSETAVRLLDKFAAMVAKYKYLMLKESMKETSCAERVMVERMFCNDEKVKLEQDKLLVAQGEILELPSPPESWVPRLQEMVDADMKELELDSTVNLQVQSAIDSIISCGTEETSSYLPDDSEKIEYDAFGVPTTSSSSYGAMGSSSSADIDEAVRSILA